MGRAGDVGRGWTAAVVTMGAVGAAPVRAQAPATFHIIEPVPGYLPVSDALVSANGAVVVGALVPSSGLGRMYRWTAAGGTVALPDLLGAGVTPYAVSADGSVIVGSASPSTGSPQLGWPFRWTAGGGYQVLAAPAGSWAAGVSADGGVLVGVLKAGSDSHVFRWTAATGVQDLGLMAPGDRVCSVGGVNSAGTVIFGTSGPSVYDGTAFRWTAGSGFSPIGALFPYTYTRASAMSADGMTVAGFSVQGYAQIRPRLWTPANPSGSDVAPPPFVVNDNSAQFSGITADGSTILGTSTRGGWLYSDRWGQQEVARVLRLQGAPLPANDQIFARAITPDGGTLVGSGWHDTGLGYSEADAWIATLDTRSCIIAPGAASTMGVCRWEWAYIAATVIASPAAQYQWRHAGVPVVDDADHRGSRTAMLEFRRPREADLGVYDCVVSQPCGSVTTPPVTLVWRSCRADQDCSGEVSIGDLFSYLSSYFALDVLRADIDGSGAVTLEDLFGYLRRYFGGC